MRGLWKATGYWNTVEAWRDWEKIADQAKQIGIDTEKYKPANDAGWRKIDKAIAKLRAALEKVKGE